MMWPLTKPSPFRCTLVPSFLWVPQRRMGVCGLEMSSYVLTAFPSKANLTNKFWSSWPTLPATGRWCWPCAESSPIQVCTLLLCIRIWLVHACVYVLTAVDVLKRFQSYPTLISGKRSTPCGEWVFRSISSEWKAELSYKIITTKSKFNDQCFQSKQRTLYVLTKQWLRSAE